MRVTKTSISPLKMPAHLSGETAMKGREGEGREGEGRGFLFLIDQPIEVALRLAMWQY